MKLSIATYNILHCENDALRQQGKHVIDPLCTADTVDALQVSVCGLNEVRRQSGDPPMCDQAKVIGNKLGMHAIFAKAINISGGEYGNALLSRFPIESVRIVPIQTTEEERRGQQRHGEDRVLLIARLSVEGKTLTVMVSHFGLLDIEKARAIETLRREVAAVDTPLVFMGDLNLTPDSAFYAELTSFLQDASPEQERNIPTFSRDVPQRKIDYIFTNALCRAEHTEAVPIGVSDHLPLRTDIVF